MAWQKGHVAYDMACGLARRHVAYDMACGLANWWYTAYDMAAINMGAQHGPLHHATRHHREARLNSAKIMSHGAERKEIMAGIIAVLE